MGGEILHEGRNICGVGGTAMMQPLTAATHVSADRRTNRQTDGHRHCI